ncbi:maleylacetate reductase [Marinomonas polaris]|uniref:maleylacetate reductase n=1 Tax=Marinomonas polaris TaxID=293552 RepID=UPI003F986875
MKPFVYNALPSRVIFGSNTLYQIKDELRLLGKNRGLVLSTAGQHKAASQVSNLLGEFSVGCFNGAVMHTPITVTNDALKIVMETKADCIIAIGGGSTIGLAKAIALNTNLPQIVIPTTYAGSEATPIIGQTENGVKTTQRTLKVLPEVIIYDVELTKTLPVPITITSAMNAIAHAIEALYSKDANPFISMLAEQGIEALARAIPIIYHSPLDSAARSDALFGAWACGTCLGAVGMSIHHKLCHTLGGSFSLPHAETHTVILPHAVAYNESATTEVMARVAKALGVSNAAQGLYDLAAQHGAPTSLKEIGMNASDINLAVEIACASPYWNPRPIEANAIHNLLSNAFYGKRP